MVEQILHQGLIRRRLLEERSIEGLLSSGVERSSVGARPLVRVYSPRELRRTLREAGLEQVTSEVWHFLPSDTFITAALERRGALRSDITRQRIGRLAGWYVVGRGRCPS
jgi:hypothetical protein